MKIWYKEWINTAGWNMRFIIQSAPTSAQPFLHVVSPANAIKLGSSLINIKNSKWSFKDNPIAAPDAPSMEVTMDWETLPSDLQGVLLAPFQDTANTTVGIAPRFDLDDFTQSGSATVPTTNICYLVTDRGNSAGTPLTATITTPGSAYHSSTGLSTTTSGSGTGLTVDITAQYHAVSAYALTTGGTGYSAMGHGNTTTGGTGHNFTAELDILGGVIQSILSVDDAGYGYTVGDVLTFDGGNGDGTMTVSAVTGTGAITAITLHGGTGYSVGDSVYISGGGGTGAVLTIATISASTWYVEFAGAQGAEYGGKLGVKPDGTIGGEYTVVFYDLVKTILERTPAKWLANTALINEWYRDTSATFPSGASPISGMNLGYAGAFIDACGQDTHSGTSYHYALVNSTLQDTTAYGVDKLTGIIYSLAKYIRDCGTLMLNQLWRVWTSGNMSRFGQMSVSNSPISHLVFYKQNYSTNHKRGSALSEDNVGFIGAIVNSFSGAPVAGWNNYNPPGGYAGVTYSGMLVDDKNGECITGGSLWDLFRDLAANFGCKLSWSYTWSDDTYPYYFSVDAVLQFLPLLGAVTTPVNLDLHTDRTDKEWYDYEPGYSVLSDASGEMRNTSGEDQATYKAISTAPKSKGRASFPLVFHNAPSGLKNDESFASTLVNFAFAGGVYDRASVHLSLRKLFYIETGSTSPYSDDSSGAYSNVYKCRRAFKVHEAVTFYAGYLGSTVQSYKYWAIDDGGDAGNIASLSYGNLYTIGPAAFIDPGWTVIGQQSSIGSAVGRTYVDLFGRYYQALITRTYDITPTFNPWLVGQRVDFTPPSGSPIPTHAGLAQGYILGVDADWDRGTMTLQILAGGL